MYNIYLHFSEKPGLDGEELKVKQELQTELCTFLYIVTNDLY